MSGKRNCDRFKTAKQAHRGFAHHCSECNRNMGYACGLLTRPVTVGALNTACDSLVKCAMKWLFEEEGDG